MDYLKQENLVSTRYSSTFNYIANIENYAKFYKTERNCMCVYNLICKINKI